MDLLFVTHALNGLLMVAIPVALGVFLARRFHLGWRIWLIGGATFILSQVGHIPFNQFLTGLFQNHILPAPPAAWKPFFNPVVLGLSAGLWEELSRAAIYRWWAKDARSWRKGVLLGAGHGGVEAILLGLLVLYAFFQMTAIRNLDLSQVVPAAQLQLAQQQVSAYWTAAWPLTLLGAVERIFTIPCQIALSVLVLQAFTRRQPAWIALAVLWHALLDASTVYFAARWSGAPWGTYAVEGLVGLFALLSLGMLFALHQPEPPEPEVVLPTAPPPLDLDNISLVDTSKNIDDSRYL
jgi:uncharacterized membrane protein YhfC